MSPACRIAAGIVTLLMAFHVAGCRDGPKASQTGTVTQRVGGTEIAVRYDRPVARGRALFGGIVPWGELWTPGANRATRVEFDTDVWIAEHALPAGPYSIWLIPRQEGPWTLIFNREDDVHHLRYAGEEADQLRVGVEPRPAFHMETLAIYFPVVAAAGATLRIHWGSTALDVGVSIRGPATPP